MDKKDLKFPLPPSRIGKKRLSGYFEPAIVKELKMLAAQTGESIESLPKRGFN